MEVINIIIGIFIILLIITGALWLGAYTYQKFRYSKPSLGRRIVVIILLLVLLVLLLISITWFINYCGF